MLGSASAKFRRIVILAGSRIVLRGIGPSTPFGRIVILVGSKIVGRRPLLCWRDSYPVEGRIVGIG